MRTKPRNKITSRAEAEEAMERLNEIDRYFNTWALTEAKEIADIKKKYAEHRANGSVPELQQEKALLLRELEAWAEADRESWGKKSIDTPFGRFGFREGNPAVQLVKKVAKSFDAALELLQKHLPQYVRRAPEIDRDAILADDRLEKLNAAELRGCGLKVGQKEDFWVETAASQDLERALKELKNAQ